MAPASLARNRAHTGLWAALALAMALAAPAAVAEPVASGHLLIGTATLAAAAQSGSVSLLHAGRDSGSGVPRIHIAGASITWTQSNSSDPTAAAGGQVVAPGAIKQTLGLQPAPTPQDEVDATFDATDAQPQFLYHIYSAQPLQATATVQACTVSALQKPHFGKAFGIAESRPEDVNTQAPPDADFAEFDLGSPVVLTAPRGPAEITLAGDFTLEVWGVSGTVAGAGGEHAVRSGTWHTPVAPGAPDSNAYNEERSFVRMQVRGGLAHITFAAGESPLWAGSGGSFTVTAPATFDSATGSVTTAGGQRVDVNAAHYTLEGRNSLQMTPAPAGLDVAVTGMDADGRPIGTASGAAERLPDGLMVALGLLVAGSAAVVAATWGIQHRLRRQPVMADVEAALEAGQYRQAARDAGRILRKRPGMETALISRAIALSKAGKNQRVVAEVQDHLKEANPSDGVLHYVLGVAYVDLGQPQEAEAAFREALQRTPDLLPEVQVRLPSGSRLPAPSSKSPAETHGYA